MKKSIFAFVFCLLLLGCSKSPGSQETGYQGLAWGAGVETVAKHFGVAPELKSADSLFGSYPGTSEAREAVLLKQGFSKLLTGKSTYDVDKTDAVKHMAILDQGKSGYSLFFDGKFGMNLDVIKPSDFHDDHDALMKRYGVIDNKVDHIANEYESSYFIEWHDKDGVILLARETYTKDPSHKLYMAAQIIHMDKKVFDAISSDLKQQR